jgi:hypothetical protein
MTPIGVAPTLLDREVEGEPALRVDRGEVQLRVEDLDVGRDLDVGGGDLTRAALVETEGDRLLGDALQHEVLEVQDQVGDVFLHTWDHVELVERFVEAHLRDGCTRDRGEQRAAEAVAERVAEAGLEGGDDEALGVAFGLEGFDLGTLDDEHGGSLTWSRARR